MTAYPWLAQLNGARQRAVWELSEWGAMTPDLIAAIRDEHYEHAADVVLSSQWAKEHRFTGARLARQLASGEQQ